MASAIFDKLSLRSEDDLRTLTKLLDESLRNYLQAHGDKLAPERRAALEQSVGGAFKEMQQFLAVANEDGGAGLATPSGAPLRSPVLPPLSPLPRDDESAALEAEVEAASRRVAGLRAVMQGQLQAQLTAKLAAARPSAQLTPPREGEGGAAGGDDPAPPLSPGSEELGARLETALGAFPALLARLGEAGARLDKVAAAAAADAAAARQPPNTIRKAVLGADAEGDEEDDGDDSDGDGDAGPGAAAVGGGAAPSLAEGPGQ